MENRVLIKQAMPLRRSEGLCVCAWVPKYVQACVVPVVCVCVCVSVRVVEYVCWYVAGLSGRLCVYAYLYLCVSACGRWQFGVSANHCVSGWAKVQL